MRAPIRIHAVTVCRHYDDFLEQTARVNYAHFADWVVVTSADDKGTHAVCERYGIRAVDCPYFERGSKFNKALAINLGLAHLQCKDAWLLHIDADIALPRDASRLLNLNELDPSCLYGVDRVNCPNEMEWARYLLDSDPYQKHWFGRAPRGWQVGTRLLHADYGGYVPIGFFQLWHSSSGIIRYPVVQTATSEHTDVLHGLAWPPEKRHLIPSFFAIHLATGGPNMGANWSGRTTPRFRMPGAAAMSARPQGRNYA